MNSKNKNTRDLYRGTNDFKRGYQPSSNIAKDENGDLLADSHNILNRWRNYFSQLLNVHRVSAVRQTEIHTAELLVPDPSHFDVESAIAKLKRHKSPDTLPELLEMVPLEVCREMWFQHDVAPTHCTNVVREYLDETLAKDGLDVEA
ncbi:hypothetical protein B7P43_G02051 [Cryptotermes secundus]|uniref:Uncharacterized protein n=1 Tax=Cryptotermes secundus TaxID=105785 RepID=A0A2J7QQT8_9NEOP|nr:hypothetical protein B7P43_G02051 [Cryptotermes secundus]